MRSVCFCSSLVHLEGTRLTGPGKYLELFCFNFYQSHEEDQDRNCIDSISLYMIYYDAHSFRNAIIYYILCLICLSAYILYLISCMCFDLGHDDRHLSLHLDMYSIDVLHIVRLACTFSIPQAK